MKNRVVVIIPAYNEEKTLGKVLREVVKYVNLVIVIDDGSNDNTVEKVKHKKIILLKHIINLGQGAALQTGFEFAREINADIVVTFDADGQFRPSQIKRLIKPIVKGKADVVLGSRFLGRVKNIPQLRLAILKLGIFFTWFFSRISLSDTHNGFRAFNKYAYTLMDIKHNRWAHPSDIIFQISKNHFRVVEVPVDVNYTKYSLGKGQRNIEALKIPFQLISRALLET